MFIVWSSRRRREKDGAQGMRGRGEEAPMDLWNSSILRRRILGSRNLINCIKTSEPQPLNSHLPRTTELGYKEETLGQISLSNVKRKPASFIREFRESLSVYLSLSRRTWVHVHVHAWMWSCMCVYACLGVGMHEWIHMHAYVGKFLLIIHSNEQPKWC